MRQGFSFCGHGESGVSSNQGNFLELLKFVAEQNEDVRKVKLKNPPKNLKLTYLEIQKDIRKFLWLKLPVLLLKSLVMGYS